MYNLTRQDVAEMLNISTRSVDRYIKSGKLRSEKKGKVVYINDNDVNNINGGSNQKVEVIIPVEKKKIQEISTKITTENQNIGLTEIYKDLRDEIKEKDTLIQSLAMKVGRSEEIVKNSISLIDFKKSQFLLEESKGHLNNEVSDLNKDRVDLQDQLKHEKNTNIMLIIFTILLLIVSGILWFIKI